MRDKGPSRAPLRRRRRLNDPRFSGGGRTTPDLRLDHGVANARCPPVRCKLWLDVVQESPVSSAVAIVRQAHLTMPAPRPVQRRGETP